MNFRLARFHALESNRWSPRIRDRQLASSFHHLYMNVWYLALSFLNTNGVLHMVTSSRTQGIDI